MGNKKIIVVDDNSQILKGLTMNLKDLGYQVSSAENGKIALDLILKETPDLLITDFDMPCMNGYELITNLGKKGYTFPVIINSAETSNIKKDSIEYTGKLGFRDKLSPIKELYKKIELFLNQKSNA